MFINVTNSPGSSVKSRDFRKLQVHPLKIYLAPLLHNTRNVFQVLKLEVPVFTKKKVTIEIFWDGRGVEREPVSGEPRVVLAACSNICACVKLLVDWIFVMAESWPEALSREIFLHTYSTARKSNTQKWPLLANEPSVAQWLEHPI